ncbi:hypothetical protein ACFYU9_02970 [Streptomyces sp. NPDC004327]|uniref:hypothetical protein n=1 Tax=unclassified Streptomyces TaxID=2593676 RepID=UPI00368C4D03
MSPTRFAMQHRWIYAGAVALLLGLVITGLIRYASITKTTLSQQKADELSSELVKAGYPAPDTDTVQQLLGTDGGAVCADPDSALRNALYRIQQLSTGAPGPGNRPVIADTKAVEAERIVLQVYCPDQVDDFDRAIQDLKTDDTVRR